MLLPIAVVLKNTSSGTVEVGISSSYNLMGFKVETSCTWDTASLPPAELPPPGTTSSLWPEGNT
eukprot:3941976-Rhodomonas_salina.12